MSTATVSSTAALEAMGAQIAMPLFHVGGTSYALMAISLGAQVVMMRTPDPAAALAMIEAGATTIWENWEPATAEHPVRIDQWGDEVERLSEFVDDLPARIDDYEQLLTDNRIWKKRTVGIGVISGEECIEWGVTGPVLRASGVEWDLRRAQPYECYDELDFAIPTRVNGDTYDRYIVRVQEMRQSARILRQCIDRLLPGEIRGKVPRVIKPVAEEVYASVESPKGELGFYCVSNGSNRPYRMHVRPPSFINLQALPRLAKGHLVSDLVALIGTIDIVLGEVDR